ncbi:TPA: L,D-transpeptidase family protein, partial [Pseudomonas aeruginosa]
PYMQRLTWDGIALHAGNLPGYPASHGCIRLPMAFAKKLYGITGFSSTTVIISNASSAPKEVDHPGLLAPTVADGRPVTLPVEPGEIAWNDPGAERGPLSVLISRADQRAYVYRGGQRIGTAPVQLPARPQTGMAVFSLLEKPTPEEISETSPNLRWSVVQVSNPGQGLTPSEQLGKIRMDPTFVREMLGAMDVGSTLVITDWASTRDTHSDSDFTVIATETPNNPTKSLKK